MGSLQESLAREHGRASLKERLSMMSDAVVAHAEGPAIPIRLLAQGAAAGAVASLPPAMKAQAELAKFSGKPGEAAALVGDGGLEMVLAGRPENPGQIMAMRALPARLPAGVYSLADPLQAQEAADLALAWCLGAYNFDRYRKEHGGSVARLVAPESVDLDELRSVSHACALARDMINTPAADMGALQIEAIAREVAEAFGAAVLVTKDDDLRAAYPAIHAVGQAAAPGRGPRMIEISWGEAGRPLVAIVGKGVVFDTGGLDIKSSAGMRLMKKDMGGAAHALALGRMVMAANLPIRVAILLPVAENALGGAAMRPGDVIGSRKGLSIEIGNTDAEGRLILADALTRAAELEPDLTFDLATLTGAARAALGPDLPPFYTEDDALADEIAAAGREACDPLWRMPLWQPYDAALDSDIADLKNDPDGWAQAGSVTAALFLKRFAPQGSWAHFDIFGWNPRKRPGWPQGAEVQAVRALYRLLKRRYP
jgi:leucyl aminopeptidase